MDREPTYALPRRSRWTAALQVALLVAIALLAYGNTERNGFVWDDVDIIVRNPATRGGWSSLPGLFSSGDATASSHHAAYYRPLTRLSYVVDHQAFGLEPAGWHLVNVGLHVLTVVALYAVLRTLFGSVVLALSAAALMAVHPVNTEAVDFVSARNTVLATLFVLVSLLAYHRGIANRSRGFSVLAPVLFLCGLLSKETAVVLLAVLPLYDLPDRATLRATARERLGRLAPFAVAVAVYLALRTNALSTPLAMHEGSVGLAARLARNAWILPRYLGLIVFPSGLNAYHVIPPDWPARWGLLALAWAAIAAGVLLLIRLRSRPIAFGLMWLALNLLPVSGLVAIPSAPMAERYLYLPAIGVWIIAGALAARAWSATRLRRPLAIAAVALLAILGVMTARRNEVWRDPVTFYTTMARSSPDAILAHYSLGLALWEKNDVSGARDAWLRAAALDPAYFDVSARLGTAFIRLGDPAQAERWLTKAVELNPASAPALFNLGALAEAQGRMDDAIRYYRLFLERHPPQLAPQAERVRAKLAALGDRDARSR